MCGRRRVKTGKFDYDAPVAGLTVVDRYTLKIRLNAADLRFLYVLAVPNTAAVAREVVEAYGNDFGAHPVGTGPYMLGQYKRSSRIELLANPGLPRGHLRAGRTDSGGIGGGRGGAEGQAPAAGARASTSASSRKDRGAGSPSSTGEIDYLPLLPANLIDQALANGKLKPDLAAKGILHQVLVRPSVVVHLFQHGGSGGRRLRACAHRAAPRDRHGLQQRRGDPRAATPAARFRPAAPFPRTSPATIRSSRPTRSSSIPRRRALAGQVRLQGPRRRRLP